MDFGESLPPTLTTLMHKQFLLYRLFKEPEAELGVLITKKIQRDRRTSGKKDSLLRKNCVKVFQNKLDTLKITFAHSKLGFE